MEASTILRTSTLLFAIAASGCATQAGPAGTAQRLPDEHCLTGTGSRLPPPKNGCLAVHGRSYSSEELGQTGRPLLGDALRSRLPY